MSLTPAEFSRLPNALRPGCSDVSYLGCRVAVGANPAGAGGGQGKGKQNEAQRKT